MKQLHLLQVLLLQAREIGGLNEHTGAADAGRLFGIHGIRPPELLEKLNEHTCNVIQFSEH